MKKYLFALIGIILGCIVYLSQQHNSDSYQSKIVVTIKPIHSLVCRVLEGIDEPILMEESKGSPHTADLRPSDVQLLEKADTVIWVGNAYESAMGNKLSKCVDKKNLLTLLEAPKLKILHLRTGNSWGVGCCHGTHHCHDDGHVWLDIDNAIAIVRYMGEYFSRKRPLDAKNIRKNTEQAVRYLANLDREIKSSTRPFKGTPYIIYHDALQYFDHRYKTRAQGALVHEPGEPLKPNHMQSIHKLLKEQSSQKPVCVLSETEYQKEAQRVIGEHKIKIASFDYLGSNIQPGPEAYAQIMRSIVRSFQQCCLGLPKFNFCPPPFNYS